MDATTALNVGRMFRPSHGDGNIDFIDQLNYQFSSGILLILISILGLRHYVGKPIQCWVPVEYSTAWEEYAENICWVSNTYFLLPHEGIPEHADFAAELQSSRSADGKNVALVVGYYQWVAIVLAGQAVLLWLPQLVWRVGAKRWPVLFHTALEAAIPDRELRRKAVLSLVGALEEIAEAQSRYRRSKGFFRKCCYGVQPGSRFTTLFFLVRSAYVANSLLQLHLMRLFIGQESLYFGIHLLQSILAGYDWNLTGHFPRVTFCAFKVRKVGSARHSSYVLQCVLPMNLFIEKMYIFLWFWFVLLACVTTLSTVHWAYHLLLPSRRVTFISQYLRALRHFSNTEQRDCSRFVHTCLHLDGVLMLRAVSNISGELMALDVTVTLWKHYRAAKLTGNEEHRQDTVRLLDSLHKSGTSTTVTV